MRAKLHHSGCPGLSASGQHLQTKVRTGLKRGEVRSPWKHVQEQRITISRRAHINLQCPVITLFDNNNNENLNLAVNKCHEI